VPAGTRARRASALLAGLVLALLCVMGASAAAQASTTTPLPSVPVATESAPATAESIRVLVRLDRAGVPDVAVTVQQAGTDIGTGTTDAEGVALIPVPAPGEYQIILDTESLPEGTSLRDAARNPATTMVNPQQTKPAAFPIVEGESLVPAEEGASGGIPFGDIPQLLASGLRFGLIIALAAIGLSVIFGTTGLTNFAHGDLVTFGALMAFFFHVVLGLPLIVGAILAVVAGGLGGLVNDLVIWQPLRRRGTGLVAMMIVSIGLGLVLRYFFSLSFMWGTGSLFYQDFQGQRGIDFGSFLLRPIDLFSMALAVVVLVAVSIALLKTRIGKATRAVADNPALAAASGINVDAVIRTVWITGGALAALSGILLALGQGMNFQLGLQILLLIFAAVTLGGLGTAFGALVGALITGVFIEISTLVLPNELKYVGALFVLIVVLLVRPQGILGRAERVG